MNTQELLAGVTTEDDALNLINAVHAKFDLPTAVISTADITDQLRERLGRHHSPAFVHTFLGAMADDVRQTPYLTGARDHLAEEGNLLVESGVVEVEELLAPDSDYTYGCLFQTGPDDGLHNNLEVRGFDTAEQAYQWGIDHVWLPVRRILADAAGSPCVLADGTHEEAITEGMGLLVYREDMERQAYLPAVWAAHLGRRGPND